MGRVGWDGEDGPTREEGRWPKCGFLQFFSFFSFSFLFSISNLNYPNQIQIHVLNFQFTNIKLIPNEDITSTIFINIIFPSIPFISVFKF
jgi:hypothetical protein